MARQINLLDAPKKTRSPYATALQLGIPIALALLIMGSWAIVARLQASTAKQQLDEVEAQLQPVNEQLTQLQAGMGIDQVNAGLRERLERARAQLKARKDIQTALQRGDLGSTQGFSGFMRAFARQTVPGLWLTGLKLENGGHDITLTGRALNAEAVASLVRQLRAEPALRGRSIATMRLAPVVPTVTTDEASAPQGSAAQPPIFAFEISSVAPAIEAASSEAPAPASVRAQVEQFAQGVLK